MLALLIALAPSAFAGEVVSAKPDAVAVTVYRDGPARAADLASLNPWDTWGLALVIEKRTVDLPAGRSRLRFEGVADGIIPQSAAVEGLGGRLVERNFDYDLLSPASLIAHSVGQKVQVVRTDRKTGRERGETATLVSGPDGVMLDVGGRVEALHCGGEAERLVFDHAPAGLSDRPTLSVVADVPAAGRFTVKVSYLTVRVAWSADYIARINPGGDTLNLTGWITLANAGATGFADAPTQVVAGNLARQPLDLPRASTPGMGTACWPGQTTHGGWIYDRPRLASLDEVMVTASRGFALFVPSPPPPPPPPAPLALKARVIASELGDYKLYSLAEPTTVAARQTKQILFLSQPAVKFATVYRHQVFDTPGDAATPPTAARVILSLENKAAKGLGHPLPAGSVQVRRPAPGDGGRELFVGEYPLARDVPVDEPFELDVGAASDITVARTVTSVAGDGHGHVRRQLEIRAANARDAPVTVEIRHARQDAPGFTIVAESAPHGLKAGDPLWRLTVPAGADTTLTYTVQTRAR